MAVVIQQIVGRRHGDLFYPSFSGAAQSHNFYPVGPMKPEDGIAQVALGLGKMIVEGGQVLRFCPTYPKVLPQYASPEQWVDQSQRRFFALRMDKPFATSLPCPDDNLDLVPITRAEQDGELGPIVSTYSVDDRILRDGLSAEGPRVVTFAGLLKSRSHPIMEVLGDLLDTFAQAMGCPVEMEFAGNLGASTPEIVVLQLRPLNTGHARESVKISNEERQRAWCYTERSLGNGVQDGIVDIVYVRPSTFDRSKTGLIATEIGRINETLVDEGRPYALVGFGRWGSTDPWLGIGVSWAQIAGARVMVEASLPEFRVDPSQGTHFFHNMTSLGIGYLSVPTGVDDAFVDWEWLESLPPAGETAFLRHVRLEGPTIIKLDGRNGRAAALKP